MVVLQTKIRLILIIGMLGLAMPTILHANPLIKRGVAALITGIAGGAGKSFGRELYEGSRLNQSSARVCFTSYGVCPIWVDQPIPTGIACYCSSVYGDFINGITR